MDEKINVLVDYIPNESSAPRRASVSSVSALSNAIGSSSSPATRYSLGVALSAAGVNDHDRSQSVVVPSQQFQSQSQGLVLQQQQQQQQQSFHKSSASFGSSSSSVPDSQHGASTRPVVPMSVFVSAPVKGRVTGFAPPILSPESQLQQQQIMLPQTHEASPASQTSPSFAAFSSPSSSSSSSSGSPSLQPQANPQSLLSSALSSAINGDHNAVDYFSAHSGQHLTQQAIKYPNQQRESIGFGSSGVPPRHPPSFVSGTPPSPMLSARTPPQVINQPVSHGTSAVQQVQHYPSAHAFASASPHLLPSMLPTSTASSVAAGFMLPSSAMTALSSSPSSSAGASILSHPHHLMQQQQQQQRPQHQQSSGYTHPLPPLPPLPPVVSQSPAVSRPLSPVFATGSPSGMRRISSQEAMGLVSAGSALNLGSSPLIANQLGPGAIPAPRSQRRSSSGNNLKAQEALPSAASGQALHVQPANIQPQFFSPPTNQPHSSHSSSAIAFGTTPPSPVLMPFQQPNHSLATVPEFNGFSGLPAAATSISNSADYGRGQASVPLSINQSAAASSTRRHQRTDSMVSSGAGSLPTGSYPGSSHMLSFASHAAASAPTSRSLHDFTLPPRSSLPHDLPRLLPSERLVSVTDLLGSVPHDRNVDDDDDGPSFSAAAADADATFGRAAGIGGSEPRAELGSLIALLRMPSSALKVFRHQCSSTQSISTGGPPMGERVGEILDDLDRLSARLQSFS